MRLEDLTGRESSEETPDQRFRALLRALSAHGRLHHEGDLAIRRVLNRLRILVPGKAGREAMLILRPGLVRHELLVMDLTAPVSRDWEEASLELDLYNGYLLEGEEAGSATVLARRLKAQLMHRLATG